MRYPPTSGSTSPEAMANHQLLAMLTGVVSRLPTILADVVVIPESSASSDPSRIPEEYPAVVHAKAPIMPASGCRPAARKTSAASGGITIIDGSDMTWPCAATKATTYGSADRGARAKTAVIAAFSSPDCSATPMASSITTTLPSGGKSMKLATKLVRNQVIPSPVSSPCTGVALSVPGTVTLTPSRASTVDATATIASR